MQDLHHGQEIYLFFYRYGVKGIYGLFLCSILIGTIVYKTLKITYQKNITTYKDFLKIITPGYSNNKSFNLPNITNIIINIFLLITFFLMVSGFGAYFSQEYRNKQIIRSIFACNNLLYCVLWGYKKYCKNK